MLGLELSLTGFHSHVKKKKKKESVMVEMRKLWSLKELRKDNKRKLFKALISSKASYPPFPLHCTYKTSLIKFQRMHNSGARYITDIRRQERRTNRYVNEKALLKPVKVILYGRAFHVGNKIITNIREE